MSTLASAVDIGATSGRLLLAEVSGAGKVESLSEVHRFRTPLVDDGDGHCHWDVDSLFSSIVEGLRKCAESGRIPSILGIDSFGVDYALLDQDGKRVGEVVSYRDSRTEGVSERFESPSLLFDRTGIQPMAFNSCYQLFLDRESGKLAKASGMLFLPCYLAYLLTGVKKNELSIASTSGLLTPGGAKFEESILGSLGLDPSFFYEVVGAGSPIGTLKKEIADEIGFDLEVRAALGHDTAAAFLGAGAKKGEILLSSGTWSLLGVLKNEPTVTREAFLAGFSNELSRPGEVRFLKNISGMYIANRLRSEILADFSIEDAVHLARKSEYRGYFDPNDPSLMNPASMEEAIRSLLGRSGFDLPLEPGDYFKAVYVSLAKAYAQTIDELMKVASFEPEGIRVFGGGSKNVYLNELTALETRLPVYRGPSEATGVGNVLSIIR